MVAVLLGPAALAQAARPTRAVVAPPARAAVGTFQLVPLTNKVQVALTTDALTEIERRRRDDEEVSWQLNAFARVRILPRRMISAPNFQPLAPTAPMPAQ